MIYQANHALIWHRVFIFVSLFILIFLFAQNILVFHEILLDQAPIEFVK